MRAILTWEPDEFGFGFNITSRSRIAIGLGPILLGLYWGPKVWRYRCAECQHRYRVVEALAAPEPPGEEQG